MSSHDIPGFRRKKNDRPRTAEAGRKDGDRRDIILQGRRCAGDHRAVFAPASAIGTRTGGQAGRHEPADDNRERVVLHLVDALADLTPFRFVPFTARLWNARAGATGAP